MNVREQGQWLRLRELRVQRAREQLAAADAACVCRAAGGAESGSGPSNSAAAELRAHAESGVGAWAAHLPRWGNVFSVHRDRLAERLERAEYALIDDERALEQAQEARQQKRADLSRALAREGAVQTLVKAMGAARIHLREVRVGARQRRARLRPRWGAGMSLPIVARLKRRAVSSGLVARAGLVCEDLGVKKPGPTAPGCRANLPGPWGS
jgi:hypothetical protein